MEFTGKSKPQSAKNEASAAKLAACFVLYDELGNRMTEHLTQAQLRLIAGRVGVSMRSINRYLALTKSAVARLQQLNKPVPPGTTRKED